MALVIKSISQNSLRLNVWINLFIRIFEYLEVDLRYIIQHNLFYSLLILATHYVMCRLMSKQAG